MIALGVGFGNPTPQWKNPTPQKQLLVLGIETQHYEAPQKKYYKKKSKLREKNYFPPSFYYTLYTTFDNYQQRFFHINIIELRFFIYYCFCSIIVVFLFFLMTLLHKVFYKT